jgi:hypothetical protein
MEHTNGPDEQFAGLNLAIERHRNTSDRVHIGGYLVENPEDRL